MSPIILLWKTYPPCVKATHSKKNPAKLNSYQFTFSPRKQVVHGVYCLYFLLTEKKRILIKCSGTANYVEYLLLWERESALLRCASEKISQTDWAVREIALLLNNWGPIVRWDWNDWNERTPSPPGMKSRTAEQSAKCTGGKGGRASRIGNCRAKRSGAVRAEQHRAHRDICLCNVKRFCCC